MAKIIDWVNIDTRTTRKKSALALLDALLGMFGVIATFLVFGLLLLLLHG